MRMVWQSNVLCSSAYAGQTELFVPRIAALGHEITIASPYTFTGTPLEWNGFTVLGAVRDTAGNDTIVQNHEYTGADLTVVLADPFGLRKAASALSQINLAMWFPVDCAPLSEGDVTVLRESQALPIAMSRFGERVLRSEGADPLYVPHAVDTSVFCPGDPAPWRDGVPQVGPDTFVIGLCAMNRDPQRKAFAEQMTAFAGFHARHPDSVLAMHTAPVNTPGLNLPGLAARLGISGAIAWPDAYSYDMSLITREQMATWYRGLNVLSLCSYGEGFGLPLIEAQSCGIPVVTTDAASMNELCGAGWLVSGTPFWSNGSGAWWTRPDAGDIEQAYEAAWQAREDGQMPNGPAREFAELYDADRVLEQYWKPALDEIQARIS